MSVWFCIPSARPPEQANPILHMWLDRGYKVMVLRDEGAASVDCSVEFKAPYPGYSLAVNMLVKAAMDLDDDAEWFVTGGDDTEPDQYHEAHEIAAECSRYFRMCALDRAFNGGPDYSGAQLDALAEFGVMQPCGDPWGENDPWAVATQPIGRRRHIERICGSPWMGREFCRRAYGGNGPMWPEFWHNFNDEHMQGVAEKLGILWQRRDLTHKHNHVHRTGEPVPEFLTRAYSRENWDAMKAIFHRLKAAGFVEAYDLLPVLNE